MEIASYAIVRGLSRTPLDCMRDTAVGGAQAGSFRASCILGIAHLSLRDWRKRARSIDFEMLLILKLFRCPGRKLLYVQISHLTYAGTHQYCIRAQWVPVHQKTERLINSHEQSILIGRHSSLDIWQRLTKLISLPNSVFRSTPTCHS